MPSNFRVSFPSASFVAEGGARVEARDPRAARAQLLRQRSLRDQLQLELAREHLPLELLVLADIRRDHLLHLPRLQQQTHAETIHARIVAHDGEPFHAAVDQRRDQVLGDAAETEASRGDRHVVVEQTGERGLGVGKNFAHEERTLTTEAARRHGGNLAVTARGERTRGAARLRTLSTGSTFPEPLDGPVPAARHRHIEKDKAKRDRQLPVILHRVDAAGRMHHEIGDRHLPAGDESGQPGEKPEHEQKPADQFHRPRHHHHRRQAARPSTHWVIRRREVEELLRAVLEKEQPDHDAQNAQENRFPALEE